MAKTTTNQYISAIGRRRSAIASVKLFKGKGESIVNGIAVDKYFPGDIAKIQYSRPFIATDTEGKFHFSAVLSGGGKMSQTGALVLALARALKESADTLTAPLRAAGLLTADSRVRQRRMVGTGGKARRQKQSPKR